MEKLLEPRQRSSLNTAHHIKCDHRRNRHQPNRPASCRSRSVNHQFLTQLKFFIFISIQQYIVIGGYACRRISATKKFFVRVGFVVMKVSGQECPCRSQSVIFLFTVENSIKKMYTGHYVFLIILVFIDVECSIFISRLNIIDAN